MDNIVIERMEALMESGEKVVSLELTQKQLLMLYIWAKTAESYDNELNKALKLV